MFEFFRKYNKFALFFLLLLVIPSFVMFGVEKYTEFNHTGETVAEVDGVAIKRTAWDERHRQEADRMRQQQPNIDAALLDSPVARYATLEGMVREQLLVAAASKDKLQVPDERLARLFAQDPTLASFRGPDGKFDRQRFILAAGRTPEQYEASMRAELSAQQVLAGVTTTALASPAQANALMGAAFEQREIQVAHFNAKDHAAKVQVSDADLEAYYKAHTARFQAPEQASIEYIVLDLEVAKKAVSVNEADVKSYYEQNKDRLGTKEERRASHILLTAAKDAPAPEREKAKAKAEQLLAEVRANPAGFAELAKKNSQDPGSAEQGGQLDFVSRGAMVKPFEDAMFALKKGELSNVVETEFGYHIIRLDDIKPGVAPPYEQVRAQIENDVRTQQATQEFAKQAETLTELVYQQADSLKPAADALKLQIQSATGVGRQPAPEAKGALASRNFLAALYAPESLDRKHNTEAIEVGSNQLASGRITQYSAVHTKSFAEVKEQVRTLLVAERAAAAAKTEGEAKLAAWKANAAGATLEPAITVSRSQMQSQPAALIEAALRADPAQLPAWVGVNLDGQGYAVLRVAKSLPRAAPPAAQLTQEQAQVGEAVAGAEANAYYELLKERFKVHMLVPRPAEVPAVPAAPAAPVAAG